MHTLKLMKFMFKCSTESFSMKFVIILRFLGFICVIHLSESFNWTVQTENPTLVTKGEDESLIWEFTLTADEQTKNDIFNFVRWHKFNQSSLDYDLVGAKTFVRVVGSITYNEPLAPHITIDRNHQATLLINNVRREDEGMYKIDYSVETDGTTLAYQEFNVSVLEPPEIVNVTGDQYVCVGSMVTLCCKATGKPILNITWTRVWENGTDSGELPSMDGFYVINNTSRSSHGTYRCTASNGIGDPANQTTEVIVANPSSVDDVVKSSNAAIEGHPYNLSCEVSGDPVPTVSWIKVSNDEHHVGKILNFTSISRNDAGSYTCEASNRCGKDSKTDSINVFFKPEIKEFKTSAANHTACQNDVISFNCSADANPLVTSYQLFENDTAILDTDNSGMWSRNMSTRGVFIYKCVASNTYGTGNSEKIAIHVYDPPSVEQVQNVTVMEGTYVIKECNVTTGTPPINIFWEDVKSGQVFEGKLLNITDIKRYQTEYRCIVNNTCGLVSTTMFIGVHYRPSATRSSSVITLELGEDRSIGCPVDIGNPPAVITWHKGNGTSCNKTTNSSTLEVQNASLSDKGWYTCFAKNKLGNTTVNLLLLVGIREKKTSRKTQGTN